jgi:O-antigen ligase
MPRLPQALPLAGAAVAALVAVAATSFVSPTLIVAGVLGLFFLLAMRANLQGALLGLAFCRATLEGTYLLPAANVGGLALGPGDLLTLGFFGGVLWYLAGKARAGELASLWRAPTVVPVLVFLGLAGFSLLYSPAATLGARDILKFASAYSVYLLLVADPPDTRRLRLLLIGIAVGSIVPIAVGLGQILFGRTEVNEFQGWSRVQSVFVDPNTYGFYLVTVLAAAWALRGHVSDRVRAWLDVLSVAAFASVFLTLSRNSVAALAILVVVIGIRQRKILITAVLVTAIVLLAAPQVSSRGTQLLSPESAGTEGRVRQGENARRTSLTGRVEIWGDGLELWRQRPLLGVGFGGTTGFVGRNAHNDFLRSLVEAGLVGIACFGAVMISIVLLGRRAGGGREDAPRALMGLTLGYVLVSYFSNNLGKGVFQFHFWLLAGILYVWSVTIAPSRPGKRRSPQNEVPPDKVELAFPQGQIVGFQHSPEEEVIEPAAARLESPAIPSHRSPTHPNLESNAPPSSGIEPAAASSVAEPETDAPASPSGSEGVTGPERELQPTASPFADADTGVVPIWATQPPPDLSPRDDLAVTMLRTEGAETQLRLAHVGLALFGFVALALAALLLASALSNDSERSDLSASSGPPPASSSSSPLSAQQFGDAEEVAFLRDVSGVPQIHLLALPGEKPIPLALSGAEQQRPDFSSDGTRLAYSAVVEGRLDIFVFDREDKSPVNVTNNDSNDYAPDFSPDGRRLAFASNLVDDFDIFVLDLPSGEPRRLVDNGAQDRQPAWSPDGKRIAFASRMDGDFEIYIVDAAGSERLIKVTNNTVDDLAPEWSPDGTALVFDRNIDGDKEIFVVSFGDEARQITDNDVGDLHPAWSPDGRGVFFGRQTPEGPKLYFQPLEPGSREVLVENAVSGYNPAVR